MYNNHTTTTVQFTPEATTLSKEETEVTLSISAAAALALPVDVLHIGSRRIEQLARHGITVIAQLAAIPEEKLARYSGIGPAALSSIRRALAQYDLHLGIIPQAGEAHRSASEDLQALINGSIDVYCDDDE